jgi:hypothetical protein
MTLSHVTPANTIEIWAPRWKDRKVLIAKFKVGTHNRIVFTGVPRNGAAGRVPDSLKGEFYVSGTKVRACPVDTNGKIPCYAVPLDDLEPLERT